MLKIFHLVKRKAHLTHQEFRDHFERSHAPLALKYCGHLFLAYRRNYAEIAMCGGDPRDTDSGYGEKSWAWDLVSEWIVPDEAALTEIYRIMRQPEIDVLFHADEDRFIERTALVTIPCTVFDTGTLFKAEGTVFDTATGTPAWD